MELKTIALGNIGLKPWEFYDYTFEEFLITLKGWWKQETEHWKRARLTAWAAMQPHQKKRMTPDQWLPLPGDKAYNNGLTYKTALDEKRKLFEMGILKSKN